MQYGTAICGYTSAIPLILLMESTVPVGHLVPMGKDINMQPQDTFKPYLRDRIQQIKDEVSHPRVNSKSLSPLDIYIQTIKAWLINLTDEQISRAYTIQEVITLSGLKGITTAKASIQLTGEALRRCGFYPVRSWTTKGRNKRYWRKEETHG